MSLPNNAVAHENKQLTLPRATPCRLKCTGAGPGSHSKTLTGTDRSDYRLVETTRIVELDLPLSFVQRW